MSGKQRGSPSAYTTDLAGLPNVTGESPVISYRMAVQGSQRNPAQLVQLKLSVIQGQ